MESITYHSTKIKLYLGYNMPRVFFCRELKIDGKAAAESHGKSLNKMVIDTMEAEIKKTE